MKSDEHLSEVMARISQRLQTERDRVHEALQSDPGLFSLAKLCKETFNSRITYLRCGGYEKGEDLPPGIIPEKYNKPPKGKGRVQWLRGLEREE